MMGRIFAKFLIFLLLLLLMPSDCRGRRDGEDKATDYACIMRCNTAGDAHRIQLKFNHSYGEVSPVDLNADYQSYLDTMNSLNSENIPILCTVTKYEVAFTTKINEVIKRTKAAILCTLPAKPKSTMRNESSTSYMSRHMYEITREIANLIGNYQWLKPGTRAYKEPDDRVSDLDIANFNMNSHPTQKGGEIIQMAATLSFSTTRPFRLLTELTIAVPIRSIPTQYVNISNSENHNERRITGFWIDIFEAAMEMLQMANITYKLVPFYGSDDQLLEEVSRETFDAAVGLTLITEQRMKLVEFVYPYFQVGPVIVMKNNMELNQVFSFMRPFTNEMWLTMAVMTIFTVFVIWLVEHRTVTESGGLPRQVGAIFWFSFATLFYGGHRESPRESLTYFVLAPWLFLLLIVGSVYTTSFTSMVASSDTQSSCSSSLDIENLIKTNAIIAYDGDPVISRFLVEAVGFQWKNIKIIAQSSIDDYAKALSSGDINAAIFLTPYADIFFAKYCKGFSAWHPTRNIRGSAIVLPRGSSVFLEMSEAMTRLLQSGEIKKMTKDMLSFSECSSSAIDGSSTKRGIGPGPFSGLFILSGGASAIAMLITIAGLMKRRWENYIQRMLMGRGLWVWLTTLLSQNQGRNEIELPRISSTFQTQQVSS